MFIASGDGVLVQKELLVILREHLLFVFTQQGVQEPEGRLSVSLEEVGDLQVVVVEPVADQPDGFSGVHLGQLDHILAQEALDLLEGGLVRLGLVLGV